MPHNTSFRERWAVIDPDRASGATRRMLSPWGLNVRAHSAGSLPASDLLPPEWISLTESRGAGGL
jgi:hypothetical protein